MLLKLYGNGKKALQITNLNEINYLWKSKGCSVNKINSNLGSSFKSSTIIIGNDSLYITGNLLMAGILKQLNLLHCINFEKIISIKKAKCKSALGFSLRGIKLDFLDEKNQKIELLIRMNREDEFLLIMNRHVLNGAF